MLRMIIVAWAGVAALHCAPVDGADASTPSRVATSPACDVCPEMVSLPGGEFMMGTPADDPEGGKNERPQRAVSVRPFALGKTEVTVAQWRAFARISGYKTLAERNVGAKGCFSWAPEDAWGWREGRSWQDPGWAQKDSEPVVCISWADAQAYVRWLALHSGVEGWRLPTEAEWEYAARAGSRSRRPWGEDEVSCVFANGTDTTIGPRGRLWSDRPFCKDGYFFAAPVGNYRANAWGLHDMLGNVWEWVQDCFLPYTEAPGDGAAHEADNCKARVLRGGAWDEPLSVLRSAERFYQAAGFRSGNVGLRIARSAAP